ncbi:hypothetical protein GW17_00032815 [Ensete ventricosum]|nr:hypothetical protein GW17_00032815 [Ensete ventricosum]RZS13275.1 hypothetical protein BHM03_00044844 [Ensete ventricosum]
MSPLSSLHRRRSEGICCCPYWRQPWPQMAAPCGLAALAGTALQAAVPFEGYRPCGLAATGSPFVGGLAI